MCNYLKNMERYKLNDLKLKEFDSIQEMFDRAFKRVNTFEDFRTELVEGKENRAGEELIQKSSKKQKVDDDKETAELKLCLEVISGKEEVAIDAIPLRSVRNGGIGGALRAIEWEAERWEGSGERVEASDSVSHSDCRVIGAEAKRGGLIHRPMQKGSAHHRITCHGHSGLYDNTERALTLVRCGAHISLKRSSEWSLRRGHSRRMQWVPQALVIVTTLGEAIETQVSMTTCSMIRSGGSVTAIDLLGALFCGCGGREASGASSVETLDD
ncbi:hypothetical protein Tco_0511293 [Tanacetum coccineum]